MWTDKPLEESYAITSLNTDIGVLENRAEIVYYCNDRVVQIAFWKNQLSDGVSCHPTVSVVTGQCLVILHQES